MKIGIRQCSVVMVAGWVVVLAFLYALSGQIGEVRADIRRLDEKVAVMQEDNREFRRHLEKRIEAIQEDNREFRRHLQEDNREIRRLITSHLVFHSAGSQVAVATGVGGEVPGVEGVESAE